MENKTFYLTSIGIKISTAILTICVYSLFIALLILQAPWYGAVFSGIVALILSAGLYILLFNRITIDYNKKILKVQNVKLKKLKFNEIITIEVDTDFSINPQKHCFIVFKLTNDAVFKIAGYSKILQKNAVIVSRQIVKLLKDSLV